MCVVFLSKFPMTSLTLADCDTVAHVNRTVSYREKIQNVNYKSWWRWLEQLEKFLHMKKIGPGIVAWSWLFAMLTVVLQI